MVWRVTIGLVHWTWFIMFVLLNHYDRVMLQCPGMHKLVTRRCTTSQIYGTGRIAKCHIIIQHGKLLWRLFRYPIAIVLPKLRDTLPWFRNRIPSPPKVLLYPTPPPFPPLLSLCFNCSNFGSPNRLPPHAIAAPPWRKLCCLTSSVPPLLSLSSAQLPFSLSCQVKMPSLVSFYFPSLFVVVEIGWVVVSRIEF